MEYRDIQKPIKPLLLQSDAIVRKCLRNRIQTIDKLFESTPVREGKRIRSTYFFLLAGMERIRTAALPKIAAAIEIYHLSSLIHDDIIDNSQYRRGRQTTSLTFGNHLSVLWGDYLFIAAFNLLREVGNSAITDVMIETSKTMIEGQILEYENSFNRRLAPRVYYEIICKKTAAFFSAISRVVRVMQGKESPAGDPWARFGEDFGMMFQIRDDLLDIFSTHSGKDRFRDWKEGKTTLPYILYLKRNGSRWAKEFSDDNILQERMREGNVYDLTQKQIERHKARCQEWLRPHSPSVFKEALRGLLDFAASRDY